MRGYSFGGPSEAGTGPKTAITVIGSTTIRPCVYDVTLRFTTTPADARSTCHINTITAAGTTAASAPTPKPYDSADVAATSTTGWTHSAEPTYHAVANQIIDM